MFKVLNEEQKNFDEKVYGWQGKESSKANKVFFLNKVLEKKWNSSRQKVSNGENSIEVDESIKSVGQKN